MAIDYVSAGASLLSAGGGLFGGSNKGAERAAKDAAARAQYAQELQQTIARSQLKPFSDAGTNAENELSYLLGTGGYDVARPTYDQAYNELRAQHFINFGKDYNRKSDVAGERLRAENTYQGRLKEWQKNFDTWKSQQSGNSKFGSLLKPFDQQDLDNDLVYQNGLQFGLDEGRNALEARMRASGSMGSGRALKDLTRFGNDYATTKTNDAYVRNAADKDRTVNYLGSQAGRGLGAIGTSIGVGQNAANNIGNAGINSANSVAALSQNRQQNQQNSLDGLLSNLLYTYKNTNSSRNYRTPDFNPDVNNWGTTI